MKTSRKVGILPDTLNISNNPAMRSLKSALTMFVLVASILTQSCSSYVPNPVCGNIGNEGAPLYADSSGKEPIDTLLYGVIVEYDANDKSQFVKVRDIATGAEGYADTLRINQANHPLEAPYVADEEQSECELLNIETSETGESVSGWAFWKKGNGVMALSSVTLAYNTGRMFTQQNYYLGEIHPGYILLTHSVEYGEDNGEKLETPIVIYEDIAFRAGIFEGGKCFTPGGQLGGSDTDDWE